MVFNNLRLNTLRYTLNLNSTASRCKVTPSR